MLPRLEVVRRLRPVDLVAPGSVQVERDTGGIVPLPAPAPYVAATTAVRGRAWLALHLAGHRLGASVSTGSVSLTVSHGHGTRELRSRRFHRAEQPTHLGLSLTGTHLTAWTHEAGRWVARARHDLREALDVHDEPSLRGLEVELPTWGGTAGGFGQLGLRDVRFVTAEDGSPLREDDGSLWLSATSAGPGFADAAHTSVWRLDPRAATVAHSADLYFRRPDRPGVFGDHATHVVRTDDGWLVATSTWGDFELPRTRAARRTPSGLRVTLARTTADVRRGTHVLDTGELPLPTDGLGSIATWDPHLVRRDGEWLVGYVSARKYFDFHPVLASGTDLSALRLRGASSGRTATEGPTLVDLDGRMLLLATDGRQGPRRHRGRFPVFDLDVTELGALDAPYPTNLPWPTLAADDGGWLMATFNGRPTGGKLLGYGTHGDLVLMRSP